MRITARQSESVLTGLRLPAAVGAMCLLWACPSVKSYDKGNGLEAVLHVEAVGGDCETRSEGDASCSTGACWMTRLKMQPHRLRVRRRWTVADCNGLGDCSRTQEWASVGAEGAAQFTVEPPEAASVELLEGCGEDLVFALSPRQASEFEVHVQVGDLEDIFVLQTVDACVADEAICSADLVPRCCCEPRYTTTACG